MRVFQTIREARPSRLYLASDGARTNREGEVDVVALVRRTVVEAVDWPCEVRTLFRDENLGCRVAISSAIDWFFENEEEGIILEDDCLPVPSFFRFCEEMLERHRSDERVMCVSGDNFVAGTWAPETSYYYTTYPHIWGWATWRRAWRRFELEFQDSVRKDGARILRRRFRGLPTVRRHWARNFRIVGAGLADTWDSQWVFAIWKHDGICVAPRSNLVSNIGFGAGATNAIDGADDLSCLPAKDLEFPLVHPDSRNPSIESVPDEWEHYNLFRIPRPGFFDRMWERILGSLRRS